MVRISIFLATVALIAGMVGCSPTLVQYDLTISSGAGESVITPQEGTFTYGQEADVEAAATTITMQGGYVIVAAYRLTISSTPGGSVTEPGEGGFYYTKGTVVDLVATPDSGYRFDEWIGDVDTIADVEDATTTITMQSGYSIMAIFEPRPPVNWPLIGGIIAAAVAVGLGIFFVRRRNAA